MALYYIIVVGRRAQDGISPTSDNWELRKGNKKKNNIIFST
jgi:hypothetical protein